MASFKKNALAYVLILVAALAAIAAVLHYGNPNVGGAVRTPLPHKADPLSVFFHSLTAPLPRLLLQALTVLVVARLCAAAAHRLGQPRVVGEIFAGILLGPSLLGWVWPEAGAFIFPAASLPNLQLVSQFGLILFMFIVGLELDAEIVKHRADAALLVSHVSVVVPFLLGALLAIPLYAGYAPAGVSFVAFALFIGIAMSITAFPVLARILQERELTRTTLGGVALACAAIDDVTAWALLALVIGLVQAGSAQSAGVVFMLTLVYAAVMFALVRPWVRARLREVKHASDVRMQAMTLAFAVLLGSAFVAEVIGIHALFGAFVAGVIMPTTAAFRGVVIARLEHLTNIVLLPLFFALTGLRTELGLLRDPAAWAMCAAVIAVAVAGKLGASALAARWTGMRWREALSLGALMNTRGLMELVVLNIGYDLGVLSPEAFTMFVVMALATTLMTGPLLSRLKPEAARARA